MLSLGWGYPGRATFFWWGHTLIFDFERETSCLLSLNVFQSAKNLGSWVFSWVWGIDDVFICVIALQMFFVKLPLTSQWTHGPWRRWGATTSRLTLPTPQGPPPSALSRTMLMGPTRWSTHPSRKVSWLLFGHGPVQNLLGHFLLVADADFCLVCSGHLRRGTCKVTEECENFTSQQSHLSI